MYNFSVLGIQLQKSFAVFLNLLRCDDIDHYLTIDGHKPNQTSVEFDIFLLFGTTKFLEKICLQIQGTKEVKCNENTNPKTRIKLSLFLNPNQSQTKTELKVL